MSYGAAAVGLTVVLAQGSPQLASSTGPGSAPRSRLAEQTASMAVPAPSDIHLYSRLFVAQAATEVPQAPTEPVEPAPGRPPAQEATRSPDQAPEIRVVCGTTVVTADSRVDPRMPRLTPPADVAYTIRATPPPICRD